MAEPLSPGIDGEPAYCQDCTSPIVLYHTGDSYTLTCGCPNRGVSIDEITNNTNLFDPITGGWSQVDEVDAQVDYE